MINFRKWICRNVKKFGWIWFKADCLRYEPAPIPPEPPKPPDPPDEPEYVWREVCNESGYLSNPWCPEKYSRSFLKGTEPTATCLWHRRPDNRVWVGVYDLMGAFGDWKKFLLNVRNNGGYGIRFFVCYSWQGPQPTSPYVQTGTWKHENGDTFPMYSISQSSFNKEFWDKFQNILEECARLGLHAWVVCEDYCSLKGDQHVKYFNPMYSSVEALGPETPGGVWGDAMKKYHTYLYAKTYDTIQKVPNLQWIIEDMNEGWIVDGNDALVEAWFKWSHDTLISLGVPQGRTVSTVCLNKIARMSTFFSPHGIGSPGQITQPYCGVYFNQLIYSSDGYWNGGGPADIKGRRGPDANAGKAIGSLISNFEAIGFEYLPRDAYRLDGDRANVDGLDLSTVKAIAFE